MGNDTNVTFGPIPMNTSENSLDFPVLRQVAVVDFRQWYKYGYEFILYGYFLPVWTFVNIFINSLMIVVFVKTGMTSKTHVCLIAMAICDSASPICPSIMNLYFFAIRKHFYFLPLEWCRTYHYMTEVIPQLFTSTSLYLTIMLAIQRYIVVAYPFKADRLCSKRRVTMGIITCIVISVVVRIVFFIHYDYFGITVPAFNNPNETMEACAVQSAEWLPANLFEYLAYVQAIHTLLNAVIPLIIMSVTQILLVIAITRNKKRRKSLTLNSKDKEKRETRLTLLTLAITGIAILYGICVVVVQTFDFLFLFFNMTVVDNNDLRSFVAISNTIFWIFILPSNFIITCCLSQDFRKGLKSLFVVSSVSKNSTSTAT